MSDQALLKEGPSTQPTGPIYDLVGNKEIARTKMMLQTSYSGESNDGIDANVFQGCDVGAGRDFRGRIDMAATMTSKEGDRRALGRTSDCDGRRRRAPRRNGIQFSHIGKVAEGVEASPADNAEPYRFWFPRLVTSQACTSLWGLPLKWSGSGVSVMF